MVKKTASRLNAREKLAYLRRHPLHAIYHPHQRVWNTYTSALANRLHLQKPLVLIDSLLLMLEAYWGRARKLGLSHLLTAQGKHCRHTYIFDLGLHRDPRQITAVLEWFGKSRPIQIFGFEAHPDYLRSAQEVLKDHRNVTLINAALVGPRCDTKTVRLYLAEGSGTGDSIFIQRTERYIDVKALRLSDFIAEAGIDIRASAVILRMNIEGAEQGVIEDLAEAGILEHFDGFFGSWDDMYKVNPERDEEFRALLRRLKVKSFPFNDRDLGDSVIFKIRRAAIRYALRTSMLPNSAGRWKLSAPGAGKVEAG